MEMFNPPHPGISLNELYIKEYGLSIAKTAIMLGLSRKHLSNIVNGKVPITSEVALKIEKAFSSRAGFWLDMQQAYDLWHTRQRVNLDNVQVIAY